MRKIILILTILIVSLNLSAATRSENEAHTLAVSFLSQLDTSVSGQKAKAPQVPIKLLIKQSKFDKDLYYIYGREAIPGFVIISGDTRTYDVLGYSENTVFDADDMPENMKAWLVFYEQEIEQLDKAPATSFQEGIPAMKSPAAIDHASSVQPLLGGIKWNQDAPFNNLSPILSGTTKAAAGCVATAMAQVMKFHEWPTKGTGTHSYQTRTRRFNLSANFGATTYDWANMTNTYHSGSTTAQNNAVATLLYHCAVAVEMDFDQESGAFSEDIGSAMIKYFDYDENIQLWKRDFYTRSEWIDLLKTELNANRPVLYAGQSVGGGHQFVCDGYDSNDFFHINWGWGGMSDGYFRISTLDPDSHGIGGGVGGFTTHQSLITGVQKPTPGTSLVSQFHMTDTLTYPAGVRSTNTNATISAHKVYNYGANTIRNLNYAMLFIQNGQIKYYLTGASIAEIKPLYGRTKIDFTLSSTTFNSIADGSYQIAMGYQTDDDPEWVISRYYVGNPYYLNMTKTATQVEFWSPAHERPSLEVLALSPVGNLYTNKTGRFNVKVKNNGREHNSDLGILLQSTTDPEDYDFYAINHFNIASGETFEEILIDKVAVNPGSYNMYLMRAEYNIPEGQEMFYFASAAVPVTVYAEPTTAPNLNVSSKISFPNNNAVDKDNAVLSATIQNTGGVFDEDVIAFVFAADGTGGSLDYIGYQPLVIDENETQTLEFKGNINLPDGNYLIALFYNDGSWKQIQPTSNSVLGFNLVTVISAVDETADTKSDGLKLGPIPAKDYLQVQADAEVLSYEVFTITGQMFLNHQLGGVSSTQINTSNWDSGMYILRLNTSEGIQSKTFVVE